MEIPDSRGQCVCNTVSVKLIHRDGLATGDSCHGKLNRFVNCKCFERAVIKIKDLGNKIPLLTPNCQCNGNGLCVMIRGRALVTCYIFSTHP